MKWCGVDQLFIDLPHSNEGEMGRQIRLEWLPPRQMFAPGHEWLRGGGGVGFASGGGCTRQALEKARIKQNKSEPKAQVINSVCGIFICAPPTDRRHPSAPPPPQSAFTSQVM